MSILEIVSRMTGGEILGWAALLLVIVMSLIEISPLKVNPWDNILGWFGKKTNGKLQEELKELKKQVQDMWVATHRQSVLTFAREARAGVDHSSDEWTNILNIIADYEQFVNEKHISNGIVKAEHRI